MAASAGYLIFNSDSCVGFYRKFINCDSAIDASSANEVLGM